jgi:hypothetical protein
MLRESGERTANVSSTKIIVIENAKTFDNV